MKRRDVLTGTAIILPFISGCAEDSLGSDSQSETSDESTVNDGQSTITAEPARPNRTEVNSKGPTRGTSQVDLEIEVQETDDQVQHIAENNTVRYVAKWRRTNDGAVEGGDAPTREPVYETVPFSQWATTQSVSAAAKEAADHIEQELGIDQISSGVTRSIESGDVAAIVSVQTVVNQDGDPVSQTAISFESLVKTTPSAANVTYLLENQEYEMDVPVYASYSVIQQNNE
ncbi:hypothetical protein [Haloarcula salina]|uniref:Uncharacterized protein n=1 Tax=Haloarcula salina TaxID=1429914 RepID=A0AA41KIN6_9EURY|nr:hypothetical protein [Haloarcula salina]MBV0903056.1 hypothetical protein [Haloarcula salina]